MRPIKVCKYSGVEVTISISPSAVLAPVPSRDTRNAGDSAASLSPNRRYDTLDLWRGVACIFIVIYHTTSVSAAATLRSPVRHLGFASGVLAVTRWMSVGVPMFFVISGYCISATAAVSKHTRRPISEYFRRRFRRIFPPYWCAILVQLALIVLIDSLLMPGSLSRSAKPLARASDLSGWQWIGNLTLTEIWRWHVAGHEKLFLGQSWTLCYEEQFYAVTGLILLLCPRRFFAAALFVSGLVVLASHGAPRWGYSLDGLFLDGSWLMFAAGVTVYFAINRSRAGKPVLEYCVLGSLFAFSLRAHNSDLSAAVIFAILILILHRWDRKTVEFKMATPLRVCGLMCYSLYLTHAPIVRGLSQWFYWKGMTSAWQTLAITLPLSASMALIAGWVFYWGVERHFVNSRGRISGPGKDSMPVISPVSVAGSA
ncbi:MAG TPA: acyltransferase [Tepidisphaeraceae bacterium]|nr:acyltransferase [Tepidisphaeraceae bacterium]